jgi:hypothetical protein
MIPRHLLMTKDQFLSSWSPTTQAIMKELPAQAVIGVYLAQERALGKRSDWAPYIHLLPSHFDTLPISYAEALSALLPAEIHGGLGLPWDGRCLKWMEGHTHMKQLETITRQRRLIDEAVQAVHQVCHSR